MPKIGDIADNPQTGQSVQFNGSEWVPYQDPGQQTSKMDSLAMGALKSFTAPVRLLGHAARGVGIDPFPTAEYQATENYDKAMQENPAMATTGQLLGAAPAMIAGGAMAAPLMTPGLAGAAGLGAVGGILSDAENPLTSALTAVGTLGAMRAANPAISALMESKGASGILEKVKQMSGGRLGAVAPGSTPRPGQPIPPGSGVPGMGNDAIQGAGPRVLEGTNTAQEVEAMGAKLAPWQRAALDAKTPEQFKQAEVMRWQSKLAGNDFPEEMATQRYAFTDMVKKELGLDGVENLTPKMVADGLGREGQAIGEFRKARGLVQLQPEQLTGMDDLAKNAASGHKGDMTRIVSDLRNSMAKNDGYVAPVDLNSAIKKLDTLAKPGSDGARIADSKAMSQFLNDSVESKLNPAERVAYKQSQYRYKILKTLDTGKAVSADGTVNPSTFGSNWDKKIGQTLRGSDAIGKAADTFAALQVVREHPGSTMQRVIARAPRVAKENAGAIIGSTLGVGGINALLRD